jgi:cytochrome c oxidase assembly factor CtaG
VTARANLKTPEGVERFRGVVAVLGVLAWVLALAPPLASWASRYEVAQAVQFALFALVVPALLVTGAPWRRIGLASADTYELGADGQISPPARPRLMDKVALRARRRRGHVHVFSVGLVFLALVIAWRTAPAVNALVRHPALAILESLSLVVSGVLVWLTIVESPPVGPSTTRPFRIGVAAVTMWTVWVVAYLDGMSQTSWYQAFHHVAGQGLSLTADQQLSAGSLWLISAATFLPVVFWNLIHWLQSEEDPNDELTRLLREERSRGNFDTSA